MPSTIVCASRRVTSPFCNASPKAKPVTGFSLLVILVKMLKRTRTADLLKDLEHLYIDAAELVAGCKNLPRYRVIGKKIGAGVVQTGVVGAA